MKTITLDDAGWGFPLSGVMLGATDGERVRTEMVALRFFKPGIFQRKDYLDEYARLGLEMLRWFGSSPRSHKLFICQGYVNNGLAKAAIRLGYSVERGRVTGLLQSELERIWKEHIKELTGVDLCYDPKDVPKHTIPALYYRAVNWAVKHNRRLLKTGWGALALYEPKKRKKK